jgi:epoxyqueuosine reductase
VGRRSDLRAALPWARSVVCLGLQYDTPAPYSTEAGAGVGWIARYAWGDDYHDVMAALLERLAAELQRALGPLRSRVYADTGPIVERAYAAAAGLGAWGKNTCLLHPDHGSWFFLGEIVTDLELPPDAPRTDMCGTCTACLDACPTGALPRPYVLDATRCISYLTIELKGALPEDRRAGVGRHVFGCDICQDVCPWNRKRRHSAGPPFAARPGLLAPDLAELTALVLDEAAFRERFRKSAVKRTRRRGLLRNLAVALGNSRHPQRQRVLERLAADEDPLVQEHARWALAQAPPAAV